ncbi:hypothetical protein OG453_43535 [Streptomyces sp. NBC_01381]|uniref:hypothetical protein n=1 Tax=Streptomyces sp. NBC_01381 TaxID=2903845 RepID=UPI0022502958|nr:hypothetical protein [Streptomyces sp. NBC_01381]MCX4673435.1 hypothetical protein [Streptomyces sp. NBC_01381]
MVLDCYWYEGECIVLACFALVTPERRSLEASAGGWSGGRMHPVQTCVVDTFKVDEGAPCLAVVAVAARYFGTDLVAGEVWEWGVMP